jgi:hypothetical protein
MKEKINGNRFLSNRQDGEERNDDEIQTVGCAFLKHKMCDPASMAAYTAGQRLWRKASS